MQGFGPHRIRPAKSESAFQQDPQVIWGITAFEKCWLKAGGRGGYREISFMEDRRMRHWEGGSRMQVSLIIVSGASGLLRGV